MANQIQTPVVHVTTNGPEGTTTFLDPATFPDSKIFATVQMSPVATLSVLWSSPATFSIAEGQDIEHHKKILATGPPVPFFQSQGNTAASITYLGPTETITRGFMHRTKTLDYLRGRRGIDGRISARQRGLSCLPLRLAPREPLWVVWRCVMTESGLWKA
jgi:hypothetical protein